MLYAAIFLDMLQNRDPSGVVLIILVDRWYRTHHAPTNCFVWEYIELSLQYLDPGLDHKTDHYPASRPHILHISVY